MGHIQIPSFNYTLLNLGIVGRGHVILCLSKEGVQPLELRKKLEPLEPFVRIEQFERINGSSDWN
jgi:hypothetical protein